MTTPTEAPATLTRSEFNLIWLDMEMTGLEPQTDRIIEVAVVVTDSDLKVAIEGPILAIHEHAATFDLMDVSNKNTHGRSGLIERVRASTIDEASASPQLQAFLSNYVPAGN